METNVVFMIAITFLLVHEMDAIHCKEWTIFPGLSRLTEETGYLVFTLAHLPLIFLVLAGLAGGQIFLPAVRITLDVFCLAHIGLHVLFNHHPKNGFGSRFSWLIILGTGLAGLVDIVIMVV
jgi:hypothetical protein